MISPRKQFFPLWSQQPSLRHFSPGGDILVPYTIKVSKIRCHSPRDFLGCSNVGKPFGWKEFTTPKTKIFGFSNTTAAEQDDNDDTFAQEPERKDADVEPVFYHSFPKTFYDDLLTA